MRKFETAIEQLNGQLLQQNIDFDAHILPITSPISKTTVVSKRSIPENLNLDNVYNPKYTTLQLMSTRKRPRKQAVPPRPPNSFFLFKNCYLLELRKLGYRYSMPDVCRQSKQIWLNIPPDVKEKYDMLALQAQILHQEMYPQYKFSPIKKNQRSKSRDFPSETTVIDSGMMGAFSVTNFLGNTTKSNNNSELPSSSNTLPTLLPHESSSNFVEYNNLNNDFFINDDFPVFSSTPFPEVNSYHNYLSMNTMNPLEMFQLPIQFY